MAEVWIEYSNMHARTTEPILTTDGNAVGKHITNLQLLFTPTRHNLSRMTYTLYGYTPSTCYQLVLIVAAELEHQDRVCQGQHGYRRTQARPSH
jgi:hypothetical protein